jgi:hypothetical protein
VRRGKMGTLLAGEEVKAALRGRAFNARGVNMRYVETLFLIFGFAVSSCVLAADPPPRFPNEHIILTDWQSYLSEVNSIPDVHCEKTQKSALYCISDSQTAVWVFTIEGHPAHPAVATVVLVVYGQTAAGILFRGYYAGDESAFRGWEAGALGNSPIFDKWMHAAAERWHLTSGDK